MPHRDPFTSSIMAYSSLRRVAIVIPLVIGLWLAIWWAVVLA